MFKTIISGPTPERRYRERMGFRGVNVINGAEPNGRLPVAIGSGIFGEDDQDSGIFDGLAGPQRRPTGIFFEDTSRDNYELAQPDMDWTLLRRPGVPLYPGSSSYGVVLTGPSMGSNGETTPAPRKIWPTVAAVAIAVGLGWIFFRKE